MKVTNSSTSTSLFSSEPISYVVSNYLANNNPKEADCYPKTELEWLATSTYNHAVDYYIQENDKKSKEWAEKAFMIAQWLEDDGILRDFLMEKFATLKFDAK